MSFGALAGIRFEGYSPGSLADELDLLRQGPGSESLHNAVQALVDIANGLAETDKALREQLASIGVHWEGSASDGGQTATQNATIYAEEATPAVVRSAGGVSEQGETFAYTNGRAPQGAELRGPTKLNGVDRFLGALGHTTDNAKKVAETQAAHQQGVAAMNGYRRDSQSALDKSQALPVPPGIDLVSKPVVTPGVTTAQGFHSDPRSFTPGGGGQGLPPGGTGVGPAVGGGGSHQGFHFDAGNPNTNVNTPGGGGPGQGPGVPGRVTGVGPLTPAAPGLANSANPFGGMRPGMSAAMMNEIAAVAGVAGGSAGGAHAGETARKDRLVRGQVAGEAAKPRAGGSAVAEAPEEQARAARNAEKLGARPGRGAGGLMQPAAGTAADEEDGEHVRKYGIDSDDVFGDERLVVSPVLGEDD